MAGALGLRLAGPRIYGDVRVEDRWMGDGRAEATAGDIEPGAGALSHGLRILFGSAAGLTLLALAHRALSGQQPLAVEMRLEMIGEAVEDVVDQRLIGEIARLGSEQLKPRARCRSSAKRPCT